MKNNQERIDYLFDPNLKIVQRGDVFVFSLDAVLLAHFVHVPIHRGRLIDLCSGNGAVAIMVAKRTKGTIIACEIQKTLHELAEKSVKLNGLEQRITPICADAVTMPERLGHGTFDIVTCNPPYFPRNCCNEEKNDHVKIARYELKITLEQVMETSAKLLRPGGKAAFVHRPERLNELMHLMSENRLEPKRVQFVHPKEGRPANIVLIEGMKDGKPGLTVPPPLTVYGPDNEYTDELKEYCGVS